MQLQAKVFEAVGMMEDDAEVEEESSSVDD